jgi:hypothetical protein
MNLKVKTYLLLSKCKVCALCCLSSCWTRQVFLSCGTFFTMRMKCSVTCFVFPVKNHFPLRCFIFLWPYWILSGGANGWMVKLVDIDIYLYLTAVSSNLAKAFESCQRHGIPLCEKAFQLACSRFYSAARSCLKGTSHVPKLVHRTEPDAFLHQ